MELWPAMRANVQASQPDSPLRQDYPCHCADAPEAKRFRRSIAAQGNGRKGGLVRAELYGDDHRREWGRLGGLATKSLFEMLVAELPVGTAKVICYRVPRGDGSVIEVFPSNQKSASFRVHVDDDGGECVDFSFGRIGTWELPQEGRNYEGRAEQLVQEVEQMARAVIAGKCDETRGLFSLTSRVYVEGYTYKVIDLPMLPIPPFGTRRYAPYASTSTD